jgi:hypothetical protein
MLTRTPSRGAEAERGCSLLREGLASEGSEARRVGDRENGRVKSFRIAVGADWTGVAEAGAAEAGAAAAGAAAAGATAAAGAAAGAAQLLAGSSFFHSLRQTGHTFDLASQREAHERCIACAQQPHRIASP